MTDSPFPATQRAVQLVGPDELRLNDAKPVPTPGPHELLCRVNVVGLCFSDLKLLKQFSGHVRKGPVLEGAGDWLTHFSGYVPNDKPTVPGHEPVVTVVAVGDHVKGYRVGERYFIQADWRWLKTAGSNGAFGYNFEGALQEYVLLDQRLIDAPDGESMFLPAPVGERSAAAYGLVEPWACAECSYRTPERRTLKADGRRLIWADVTPGPELDALLAAQPAAAHTVWAGPAAPEDRAGDDAAALETDAYDDVLYFGADPGRVESIFPTCRKDALILLMTCGERFGRPVNTALGAMHYRGLRLAGTTGCDPAKALAVIPENGELRPDDLVHVVGAGGPMGVMHVVRNLCQGVPGVRVVAADLSDERLEALRRLAEPQARANGTGYEGYNSSGGARKGPWNYIVLMAPVPALAAEAVRDAAPGAILNLFAGIPVDRGGPVDLDLYCERGLYVIGTSGSRMDDMRTVLRKVQEGRLNTNVSVAAISGLDGAIEGIRAVERQEIPGKILVYPACRGLEMTRLDDLARRLPEVAAKLDDGVWTLEAENTLLGGFAAAGTEARV
jgi:L-sorbose 1-phosphate reductase